MSHVEDLVRRGYSAYLIDAHNNNCKKHRRYYSKPIKVFAKISNYGVVKIRGIKDD